ncbi:MAG TPA: lysylphosphatidylglycerol synthase transmembrane domain-containing protein [Candidatus Binatia bacterium]|nr:lysylphosphatidylglycerol synthase transmembrane domain-containing protein [Candidatus Binatia bacterium]
MSGASAAPGWRSPAAVLRLLAGLGILGCLLALLPRERVWSAMRGVPLRLWLAVVFAYLAAHCLGTMKYRMMVNLAGAGLSRAQAAQCYFGGLFGTLFLPSIVGGDVVRAGVGLRVARHRAGFLLGSLMDRVMDVLALALTSAAGAVLLPGHLDARSLRVFLLLASAGAALVAGSAVAVALLPAARFSFRMRRRLVRLREAARALRARPHVMLLSLLGGILVQGTFATLTAVLANSCGLHLGLSVWFLAWPLAKLAALLPLSQGGLGVREAALAGLLLPFGAPAALAVAVGLVWQTVIYSGGLLSGLVALLARSVERREEDPHAHPG